MTRPGLRPGPSAIRLTERLMTYGEPRATNVYLSGMRHPTIAEAALPARARAVLCGVAAHLPTGTTPAPTLPQIGTPA